MSTSAQRKAWNEAMRTAAGTAALPPALQPTKQKRRSDRNNNSKASRREKARKSINHGDPESREFLWAAWMDALEDVPASSGVGEGDDDDSYDELEELNEDGNSGKNKRGVKKRRKMPSKTASAAGVIPKRLKARSLASVLLEEVNRDDGVAYAWLDNEARVPKNQQQHQSNCIMPPPRKYCPVTGMEGIYTEPKTQIPYANLQALEQIRERPPPWMILGGSIAYQDAVKSIRGEEDS